MELTQEKRPGKYLRRVTIGSTRILSLAGLGVVVLLLAFLWMRSRPETLRPTPMAAVEAAKAAFQLPRVSVTGRDWEVRRVLQSLADQIGGRLVMDPAVQGRFSIEARQADFGELMDNLCTALRCDWKLVKDPKLTLTVKRRSST